jgi:hypothetical protein
MRTELPIPNGSTSERVPGSLVRVQRASACGNSGSGRGVVQAVHRVLAVVALVVLAVACSGTSQRPRVDLLDQPLPLPTVSFALSTHCGIDEARLGAQYYEADHRLSDGSGNPPTGWPNPTDDGTATVYPNGTMVFQDRLGHTVHFHVRSGARSYKRLCS